VARPPWNHNIAYFPFILGVVSEKPRRNALDVGPGDGMLAAQIAGVVPSVIGLDLDARQVDVATAAYGDVAGLSFQQGDLLTTTPPGAPFDVVTISATIHHLDLEPALRRLAELTAPGGTLVVVGLAVDSTFRDFLFTAVAGPLVRVARAMRGWYDHHAPMDDPSDSWSRVRDVSRDILPGSIFKRRLYLRYTLVWNRPDA